MADRGDTHYHVPRLNAWFALSSVLLLAVAFWMVVDDWSRSWKEYQREFRDIEIARAEAELETPEAQAALAQEERLTAALAEVQERLDARRDEIAAVEEELRELRGQQFKLVEAEKKAKQEYNWERFQVEEGHADPETLDAMQEVLSAATVARESIDAEVAALEGRLDTLVADLDEVEREKKAAVKDVDLVRNKLETLRPEDPAARIANVVRDFPGLDFVDPSLKVNKVVLSDLTFELNFTKKPRIDMCMTCHVPIDREGYDDLGHPFQSHPNLDLYLSAKSPHPLSDFGCTICHRGSGESLHFVRSDHRPSDREEAERWEDEYHWHKQHHWDYPMLSSEYVEASCVQCHQSSMELIAEEAPRVTEGYRLFERYGCYSCHKVEWFPTERRPGPSLVHLASKTDLDWVASWIADPRAFRPSTWMPQFFHLENYPPDEAVVVSEWGAGRPILGREWNDTAVAAIASFVWDRATKEPAPPLPVEGDPERGRETFRLVGCLACHNGAPFTEEERAEARDLAMERRGTNEHGPNLRGIATKVTPEWLFAWIKDPAAYWSETRMPDLRLTDQEAADIVAYVYEDPDGWFHDVPEGWEATFPDYDREALEEQARWYFSRLGRRQLEERLDGEWADDRKLLVDVGEKLLTGHGCHSCHEIPGLENEMPIGTELTEWGSKTVDKLDWGFVPELLAEEHGWDHHRTEEFKKYREGWLEQKLHQPRSYDRGKIKNPIERLKMPWFDFSDEEVRAIGTFVVGLVEDEVQRAKMVPTVADARMDQGLRTVRQKNCAACHVIEPGRVTLVAEDGSERTVEAQILPLDEYEINAPPLDRFHEYVAEYEAFVREADEDPEFELEEVIVQLLEDEPGVGRVGDTIVVEGEAVDRLRTEAGWGGDFVSLVVDHYRAEDEVLDVDGERRSYVDEPWEKVRWTFAPPVLVDEGYKLQPEWFYRFLLDPVPLRQQMRVRMPTFHYEDGEAGSIADYFAYAANRDWPSRFTRHLLLHTGETPEEAAASMLEAGIVGVSEDALWGLVRGEAAAVESAFDRVHRYADLVGFRMTGPVDPEYEVLPQRTPSLLDAVIAEDPDFYERIHRLVGPEGPNCFQCHFLKGEPPVAEGPIAWAPDLDLVRERLRPDWTRGWLVDPARVYPGTAMPANFPLDQTNWQHLLPGTSAEQIEKVLIWLYNLDRAAVPGAPPGSR